MNEEMLAGNKYYTVNEMHGDIGAGASNSFSDRPDHDGNMEMDDERYKPRQRRRQAPEAKKICRVCGDKAFSVNFNVVTCESCKAFFRRNALKTKELRCQTAGKCEMNLQTRRSCKKCRLKKCFEVGMIKEWIMSDEARLRKRELIEKNREKRQRIAGFNKAGDVSDSEMDPRSSESERPGMDFKPLMCTIPTSIADYTPVSHHWQSPTASALLQQPSPSSSSLLFQHGSASVFHAPAVMASPHGHVTTPKPLYTILPTEPAAPGSSQMAPQVEETIRVPKTVLAALINQCHNSAITCPHASHCPGYSSTSRPSVIVSNSTPLKCICRCRCGAKATWASMGDEPKQLCQSITLTKSTRDARSSSSSIDESDSDLDIDDSISTGSSTALSLVSTKKPSREFVANFDFSMLGFKLSHVDDLRNAFDLFKHPIGRWLKEDVPPPRLPIINRVENTGDVAMRLDTCCRRMIRFCKNIGFVSGIKRRLLATLVKACANDLLMFHSLAAYIPEMDAWYDMGPNIRPIASKIELNACKGGVYEGHMKFILSFPRAVKYDVAAILILAAMSLFNPANAPEKDREQVRLMREFYSGLLTQYLESKFDADKAHRLRKNMLHHLDACPQMSIDTLPTIIVELNEQDMEPMLMDVLGY